MSTYNCITLVILTVLYTLTQICMNFTKFLTISESNSKKSDVEAPYRSNRCHWADVQRHQNTNQSSRESCCLRTVAEQTCRLLRPTGGVDDPAGTRLAKKVKDHPSMLTRFVRQAKHVSVSNSIFTLSPGPPDGVAVLSNCRLCSICNDRSRAPR